MPRPSDVVTPKTVVKIAIISILTARGLLFATFFPRSELTLKGSFLLYAAKAKQRPSNEYMAQPCRPQ